MRMRIQRTAAALIAALAVVPGAGPASAADSQPTPTTAGPAEAAPAAGPPVDSAADNAALGRPSDRSGPAITPKPIVVRVDLRVTVTIRVRVNRRTRHNTRRSTSRSHGDNGDSQTGPTRPQRRVHRGVPRAR